ncbi:hypothetical protein J3R83DRAFT_5079 [Lanmaoa asiatica]|nr:hypothetical protein J3R83DRAFT_5079 [Lanmaoa asiatica]
MGRGSGPTRGAAKESAAARALARLPQTDKRREIDDVQSTNQPSSSSTSQHLQIQGVSLADAKLARSAAKLAERRRVGGGMKVVTEEIHRTQVGSQETTASTLCRNFATLQITPTA